MHCCNINKSRRGGFFWFTWYSERELTAENESHACLLAAIYFLSMCEYIELCIAHRELGKGDCRFFFIL